MFVGVIYALRIQDLKVQCV